MTWTDACRLTYKLSGPLYPALRGTVRREDKECDRVREDAKEEGEMEGCRKDLDWDEEDRDNKEGKADRV